jgi:hypothetical protein
MPRTLRLSKGSVRWLGTVGREIGFDSPVRCVFGLQKKFTAVNGIYGFRASREVGKRLAPGRKINHESTKGGKHEKE